MAEEEKLTLKIKTLTEARSKIFDALSRFSNYVHDFSGTEKIYQLQARLEKVQSLWVEFVGVQGDLELFDIGNDHSNYRVDFEDEFFDSTGTAKGILDKYFRKLTQDTLSPPISQSVTSSSAHINANLPKIKLPEFYGSYELWLQFSDTYRSLIHNSTSLSNIEKFWYLKSCLKGEAAKTLSSLEVSEANYDKAWKIVCDRYENKKVIIRTHMKALFDIPSIPKESHISLRNLIDVSMQHLRALEALGLPVEHWDSVMIFHMTSKLDPTTKREWEDFSLQLATDTPSIKELYSFLSKRCQMLENINSTNAPPPKYVGSKQHGSYSAALVVNTSPFCLLCKRNHFIYSCSIFLKLNSQERLNKIRKLHACTICLRQGHTSKDCKSDFTCRKCSGSHNSLLHLGNPSTSIGHPISSQQSSSNTTPSPICQVSDNSSEVVNNNSQALSVTNNIVTIKEPYVLLPTAKILILDANGNPHTCRALLDNCSQSNFISKRLFEKLKLPASNITHSVEGFGNSVTKIFKGTRVTVKSAINSFSLENMSCLVTDKITKNLPEYSFSAERLHIPKNIVLADTDFNIVGPIDMLIGASCFWKLICVGQIVIHDSGPVFQKTKFGWIVSGPLTFSGTGSVCNLAIDTVSVNEQLERFWQVEEYQPKSFNSQEESECEEHFRKHTIRDSSGKFVVSLPLKDNFTELGTSFDSALKRFLALEKRLDKNPGLKLHYDAFMREYEALGHMCRVDPSESMNDDVKEFYLPHHGVIKESSSTTKLRVVFDGSLKTSSGLSLNDVLKVGPKIQDDLMYIVIRFRTYNHAFTADIEKMYRCVLVEEKHRPLQKILWRYNSSEKLNHYQLNTVTYGTSSASFLAIRSLQQAALDHKSQFPKAHDIITSSFYVDDLLAGCDSVDEGGILISQIIQILDSAGFKLRKWVTSNDALLNNISSTQLSSNQKMISDDKTTKTLGLVWNSEKDTFQYSVNISQNKHVTKRSVLGIIAQIFDPLGLIGPCIIRAKIMLQTLWQSGLDWDESLPMELYGNWLEFCNELPLINNIEIPRHILCFAPVRSELHGFSDASQNAYGACCYLRSIDASGEIKIVLICAKSKVAPLKTLTLPRLELCAALLLIRLCQKILSLLNIKIDGSFFWTDSTIVLSWISLEPNKLNTFVANRISEIQQYSQIDQWNHVASENNPADVISRGLNPARLQNCHLWWAGPSFLCKEKESWPQNPVKVTDPPELKQTKLTIVTLNNEHNLIDKFSSFAKLQRVLGLCLRFANNCQAELKGCRLSGPLSRSELDRATILLCRLVQSEYFSDEINCLRSAVPLSSKSKILRLNPILDDHGLIRVGGRLKFSRFPFDKRHPILLPNKAYLTKLIVLSEHQRNLHAGAQSTLAAIRMNFWPINGRHIVQQILRNCVPCYKANPSALNYQMGNLPRPRVVPQRPFYTTGVDFAGPFMVKDGKARNRTLVKCYLCVFVCFATKAVHLELAVDLSSESFLNCLKRFVSRRGICSEIFSDNGTNFVGAEKELNAVIKEIRTDSRFLEFVSSNKINWHFSPPYGPNFGGLWEAMVKSAKFHLKRIVGNAHLTYESLLTIFVQIEAVLNSRPLLALSNDPNDLDALTPSHFLIGEVLTALPQSDLKDATPNRITLYKQLQQRVQHFWQRWSTEYLTSLQERSKWNKNFPNISIGSLVIIKEDNAAPLCWKLGRVTEVFPGADNVVRVVSVKMPTGVVKRPITKVCLLPID